MWKWKLKWRLENLIEELKDDRGIGVVEVILILVGFNRAGYYF